MHADGVNVSQKNNTGEVNQRELTQRASGCMVILIKTKYERTLTFLCDNVLDFFRFPFQSSFLVQTTKTKKIAPAMPIKRASKSQHSPNVKHVQFLSVSALFSYLLIWFIFSFSETSTVSQIASAFLRALSSRFISWKKRQRWRKGKNKNQYSYFMQ